MCILWVLVSQEEVGLLIVDHRRRVIGLLVVDTDEDDEKARHWLVTSVYSFDDDQSRDYLNMPLGHP